MYRSGISGNKRIIAGFTILLPLIMLFSLCFTACGTQNDREKTGQSRLQIVTTIFPEYDWVMNILGPENKDADATLLLDTGVDLHSFQPSVQDIMKISECDVFIYVGGESDKWVADALKEAANPNMAVVSLMNILGGAAKEEEVIEGMQEEEEGEEEEPEYDEHVWLSLKNAMLFTENITQVLQTVDSRNASIYSENSAAYTAKLKALDTAYQSAVSEASYTTLLFGDRFPFRYLVDDYGLSYYAAFVGCSAETEASFETVTFLAGKLDELKLPAVMTIEGTNHKIAETIIQNTASKDQLVLTLDSMQATTAKDIKTDVSYLSIMEKNLDVLKQALK